MTLRTIIHVSAGTLILAWSGVSAHAATSEADKAFVAKVSQGGMYEVALGKAAEKQGAGQDIKDQGNTEAHDHEIVGDALKSAAKDAGIDFPGELNAEFKARLGKITALSGVAFDKAYVEDMKKIHAADGAAFLKEAKEGTNPSLKAFAASTYNIVQRHIGELDARTSEIR
jgi:putative membrane protein